MAIVDTTIELSEMREGKIKGMKGSPSLIKNATPP